MDGLLGELVFVGDATENHEMIFLEECLVEWSSRLSGTVDGEWLGWVQKLVELERERPLTQEENAERTRLIHQRGQIVAEMAERESRPSSAEDEKEEKEP
jgi:hypothetical protein